MLKITIPDDDELVLGAFNIIDSTKTKISKKARIHGCQQLQLKNKVLIMEDAILRADLGLMLIGICTYIGQRSVIRPCFKQLNNDLCKTESKIGSYVIIREDCCVSAVEIGSYVYVGEHSIIGNNCILKDRVYVMPGSFLPPETVVPPMAIMSGNPAKIVGQLPVPFHEMMKKVLRNLDQKFTVKRSFKPEVNSIVDSVIGNETEC